MFEAILNVAANIVMGSLPKEPVRRDQMEMAEAGEGVWVPNEQMHPANNIANRVYRSKDGSLHIYRAFAFAREPISDVEAWFYPHK